MVKLMNVNILKNLPFGSHIRNFEKGWERDFLFISPWEFKAFSLKIVLDFFVISSLKIDLF